MNELVGSPCEGRLACSDGLPFLPELGVSGCLALFSSPRFLQSLGPFDRCIYRYVSIQAAHCEYFIAYLEGARDFVVFFRFQFGGLKLSFFRLGLAICELREVRVSALESP